MKVVRFKMAAKVVRFKMRYSARETVELLLNGGLDLEDFSDSGSEAVSYTHLRAHETA